tara:strand:- start:224 stop:451 length:228 start_codon:yes stop_codon:yes gene_type:complete
MFNFKKSKKDNKTSKKMLAKFHGSVGYEEAKQKGVAKRAAVGAMEKPRKNSKSEVEIEYNLDPEWFDYRELYVRI